jgi:two-component system chemotaxis response regulator CheB
MPSRNIVVIGASAGGVRALEILVGGLPGDLQAAIFVILHTPATDKSMLPEILSRAGQIPAFRAEDNGEVQNGRIYVAPADRHMMLERGRVRVVFGPRENLFRPAIDPLFRSAAYAYGRSVIGILLSGTLDDGCEGLGSIQERGGLVVVQEPGDAEFPHLPLHAIERIDVDHVLPAAEIARFLTSEVTRPVAAEDISMPSEPLARRFEGVTCPDCSGPIYENPSRRLRFRCVAGHSYSPETMRIAHSQKLENALWSAIANFEEHAALLCRLAGALNGESRDLEAEAREHREHAAELRALVQRVSRA